MYIKRVLILFCCICAWYTLSAQTLTVTSATLDGSVNSLEEIIDSAITFANQGNDVTVEFGVTSNVQVLVGVALPTINITNGSITFQPASGATNQGIKTTTADINGFVVSGNSGAVNFYGLKFSGFNGEISSSPQQYYAAIRLLDTKDITIGDLTTSTDQCSFTDNGVSINISNSESSVNILGNSFSMVNGEASINITTNGQVTTSNSNIVVGGNDFQSSNQADLGVLCTLNNKVSGDITIENNTIEDYFTGIDVAYIPYNSNVSYSNHLTDIIIDGNTVNNNDVGIEIKNPIEETKIDSNSFTNNEKAIMYTHDGSGSLSIGNSIIESNTLGYALNNTGNDLNNTPAGDISILCKNVPYPKYLEFVGLDLEGSVSVYAGSRIIVRECKIENAALDKPIDIYANPDLCGNGCIPKPDLYCGIVDTANKILSVSFVFPNIQQYPTYPLDQFNPNFAVDFYKSNTDGDLLDYLGHYDFSSNTQYIHDVNHSYPSTLSLQTGDRIAATLTSLGSGALLADGTSEAGYFYLKSQCNFIMHPDTVCTGDVVNFMTSLTGTGYSYYWQFYDLNNQLIHTSTNSSPNYYYPLVGTYDVVLTVSHTNYPDITQSSQIVVEECCPNQLVIITNDSICLNQWIQFTSTLGNNPNYSFLWNFGDGTTSTDPEPFHYFTTTVSAINLDVTYDTCILHDGIEVQVGNWDFCDSCDIDPVVIIENANCACNGSLTVYPVGAIVPVSYLWSNGATTQTISNLCAGSQYTVTITDTNSCTTTAQGTVGTVNGNPNIILTTYMQPPASSQSCDGVITINPSGGIPPYTYLWSTGSTVNQITNACSNTQYTVVVTDSAGCVQSDIISIGSPNNPCNISLNLSPTNAVCQCNGEIDLTVSNATGNITYIWSNGAATQDITGLCAGSTYLVTVTDEQSCTATSGTYIGNNQLSYTVDIENAFCTDSCSGEIELYVSGGTSPYVISWSNGSSSNIISSLCADSTYSVTITDQVGCIVHADFTIGVETDDCCDLHINVGHVDVTCTSAGEAWVSVSNGIPPYSYLWSNGSTDTLISNLSAGYYSVTVSDAVDPNGNICEEILSFYIDSICVDDPCDDCITSFSPLHGHKYVVTAWVKQTNSEGALNYDYPSVSIYFTGVNTTVGPFTASGDIIDGWQRIEGLFEIPQNAEKMVVKLNNSSTIVEALFDDVRIHPFNATMKSFVYDPIHLRVMAESDENNYATFYEYDEEGALIRVKKETVRGVMTIKESRNNTKKTTP